MDFFNFINHFFNQKALSKGYILNEPGFILNRNVSFYDGRITYTRVVFFFEEIFKNLYDSTSKEIGIESNSKLWYQIGYDVGLRCLSYSPIRNIPSGNIKKILNLVFESIEKLGFGNLKITKDEFSDCVFVEGRHLFFVNDFNDASFFSGILAGIFSYINGCEFQVKCFECNKEFAKFKIIKTKKMLEIPAHIFLDERYYFYNLPKIHSDESLKSFSSLFDFLKFKKISLKEELNEWSFGEYPIFPCEVGFFGLIFYHYEKKELQNFFKNILISHSEDLFLKIFHNQENFENKTKLFLNILSAFGWGLPHLDFSEKTLRLKFIMAPFSGYHLESRAFFFNGAINILYGRKFSFVRCSNSEFIYEIKEE